MFAHLQVRLVRLESQRRRQLRFGRTLPACGRFRRRPAQPRVGRRNTEQSQPEQHRGARVQRQPQAFGGAGCRLRELRRPGGVSAIDGHHVAGPMRRTNQSAECDNVGPEGTHSSNVSDVGGNNSNNDNGSTADSNAVGVKLNYDNSNGSAGRVAFDRKQLIRIGDGQHLHSIRSTTFACTFGWRRQRRCDQ